MMKKLFITSFLFLTLIPVLSSAQEIGLFNDNFRNLRKGDVTVQLGAGIANKGVGLMYHSGAEYMVTDKLGLRASFSSNNISGGLRSYGAHRYYIDLTYHFIQSKRWDVYAFAGLGYNRFRYSLRNGHQELLYSYGNVAINAGVGARYKMTPNFGIQAELGRISSIGVYKKFSFKRR